MAAPNPLQKLARLYNLQTAYFDGLGERRQAPPEAILSVLRSLGAPVHSAHDAADALRQRRQALWQQSIAPVTVAWEGLPLKIKLRLPQRFAQASVTAEIILEDGRRRLAKCDDGAAKPVLKAVEGAPYVTRSLFIREPIPLGYHSLNFRLDGLELCSALFATPAQAYAPESSLGAWGIFCPLYALSSARSWGAGDFSDLAEFTRLAAETGAHAVATLPMLAGFLDEPFNPSPYAPVSRLFWNEFHLDVTKVPEFAECPSAQALAESAAFCSQLDAVRGQPLIDYRRVMELKRSVIEELLNTLVFKAGARRQDWENYVAARPALQDYAAFRAKGERERRTWHYWSETARNGVLRPEDYDERARLYHLYVQWLCHSQGTWLRDQAAKERIALYLDFPLGVNRDAYDVWRERHLFALDISGGAPPDGLFVKGQNWGFPPFHPDALRRQAYRYYRACLHHHMTYAGMLRIDHVMGLHRAFWVPEGFSAAEGLYVHSRAEEFYAVLTLESHRHQVQIVGENLGTVPASVNQALARHGIWGMHVAQFAVSTDVSRGVDDVPPRTVASLNTHDTATFMSFWTGSDIDDRAALGLLNNEQTRAERELRSALRDALTAFLRSRGRLGEDDNAASAVLEAWLSFLAHHAEFLLVNLEDLWLESAPQNVPGTWDERPNWQRKTRFLLEEIRTTPEILHLLKTIGDMRARMG